MKDDEIDIRLADSIKHFQQLSQIKTLFQRENPGLYNFGTKKINISADKNGNLKVKIGGGTIPLTDYVM